MIEDYTNKKRIFISWSKPTAKRIAEELKKLILDCFDDSILDIYVSSQNLYAGEHLHDAISKSITDSDLGILILTNENYAEQWLMYEAGALRMKAKALIPIYFGSSRKQESPISDLLYVDFSQESLKNKLLPAVSKHLDFYINNSHISRFVDAVYDEYFKQVKWTQNQRFSGSNLCITDLFDSAEYFKNELYGNDFDLIVGLNYGGSVMAPIFSYKYEGADICLIHLQKDNDNKYTPAYVSYPVDIDEEKNMYTSKKYKNILILDAKYKSGKAPKQAVELLSKKKLITDESKITVAVSVLYWDKTDTTDNYLRRELELELELETKLETTNLKYKIIAHSFTTENNCLNLDLITEDIFQYFKS